MTSPIRSSELQGVLTELTEADVLVDVLAKQDATILSKAPANGGWSAIQCIDHLNTTSRFFIPRLESAISEANTLPRKSGEYRLDLFGWLLVKSLSSRKSYTKSKTPPTFVPPPALDITATLQEFRRLQSQLVQMLKKADGLSIEKVKVQSAFNAKVRYSVYSAFRILAVHEMRHLDQAQAALSA